MTKSGQFFEKGNHCIYMLKKSGIVTSRFGRFKNLARSITTGRVMQNETTVRGQDLNL